MLLTFTFIIAAAPTSCNTGNHKIKTKHAEFNRASLRIILKLQALMERERIWLLQKATKRIRILDK